jgi:hypothetical protein
MDGPTGFSGTPYSDQHLAPVFGGDPGRTVQGNLARRLMVVGLLFHANLSPRYGDADRKFGFSGWGGGRRVALEPDDR